MSTLFVCVTRSAGKSKLKMKAHEHGYTTFWGSVQAAVHQFAEENRREDRDIPKRHPPK